MKKSLSCHAMFHPVSSSTVSLLLPNPTWGPPPEGHGVTHPEAFAMTEV